MKKISIIMGGRNDEYQNDYIFKTSYVLNYTLEAIYKNKLEKYFEVIFVDWGSKKLLSDTLYIRKNLRKTIQFLYVPKYISNKEKDFKRRINTSKAHNVGIRRSNSEFCLLSMADQIYPSYVFKNLYDLVNGYTIDKNILNKSYFYIPRKYLAYDYFKNYPSNEMVNRYFQNVNFSLQKWKNSGFLVGAGYGAALAKKKIFEDVGGLNENYYISRDVGQISPDLEYHQRHSYKYDAIDASNFGIFTYRFYEKNNNREKYLVNRLPPNNITFKKNNNWGLKDIKIQRKKIKNNNKIIKKDFDLSNILKKISLKKHLKFLTSIAKKYNLYSFKLEIVIIYFIINYFKIYGYMEVLTKNDNSFKIISDIFRGIDVYKVSLKKDRDPADICDDYKILNELKNTRVGYTKVNSYQSYLECTNIFNFVAPEKNSLIVNIELNSSNFLLYINKIIQNESKISFLIINNKIQLGKKLNNYFKLYDNYKDLTLLINKKIYDKKTKNFFDSIFQSKNIIQLIYTLFINIRRFK